MNFLIGLLQELTWLLDKAIYGFVKTAYTVFYYLANATILDSDVVSRFTLRMYMILSVIMVFVLAFNLLQYIIDPDKVNDKKVGASAFIKDVIIALVIIVMCPTIFSKLYSLQATIISSGVIPNLILGGVAEDSTDINEGFESNKSEYKSLPDYAITHGADSMIADVYVAFLYPADSTVTALDCDTDRAAGYEDYCEAYKKVKETGSLNEFKNFYKNDKYNYTPFISTIAGVVLLFFILSFCLNLGKRVGKMALLQLIAPIPVTLELVPSKKGLRKNWIDTLIKVYIEVFFFLLAIFFIIFLISLIPSTVKTLLGNFTTEGWGFVGLFTTLFLIFGLLSFGKEAPQMFFDLVGIKSTGIIKATAIRGYKMAGAGAAGVGAGVTGLVRGYNAGSGFGRVTGALGAGVASAGRGLWDNRNGGFRGISSRTAQAVNSTIANQRRRRDNIERHGGGIGGAFSAGLDGMLTGGTNAINNVRNWATGSGSYARQNERINAMNAVRGFYREPTRGFAPLDNANNILQEAQARTGYVNAYRQWQAAEIQAGRQDTATENNFREYLQNNNNMYGQYNLTDYMNALAQRDYVEENRITSQRNELINYAQQMEHYIAVHPEIELSTDANAQVSALRAALFDSNGNVRADISNASNDPNNDAIKSLHKALKDLNRQLGTDMQIAQQDINRRRIDEEARRRGQGGSGGNGGQGGGGH